MVVHWHDGTNDAGGSAGVRETPRAGHEPLLPCTTLLVASPAPTTSRPLAVHKAHLACPRGRDTVVVLQQPEREVDKVNCATPSSPHTKQVDTMQRNAVSPFQKPIAIAIGAHCLGPCGGAGWGTPFLS